MIVTPTPLEGVYRVELEPINDPRGFFARAWCDRELGPFGGDEIVQANLAYTEKQGTLRGLHFQAPPHQETKFVRCVRGSAYVVVADLRPHSRSYLSWIGVELTAENRRALLIAKGCAQGYQTLEDRTEMLYFMSAHYAPEAGRGVRYDDPALKIRWPLPPCEMSPKDLSWPSYLVERHDAVTLGR